jgi:sorbitol-specific phosphotransferase system component IIBC
MSADIALPLGYDVSQVNPAAVKMFVNGKTIYEQIKPAEQQESGDELQKKPDSLKIKLDRQKLIAAIGEAGGQTVSITVTGKLMDGRDFTGFDTIKVISNP